MTPESRNTEGLAPRSTLLQGCLIVADTETPIEVLTQTALLLDACVWFDQGEAAWREADLVPCATFATYLLVGRN